MELKFVHDRNKIYIYALCDPDLGFCDEGVRYIGKTDHPKRRLATHCRQCELRRSNLKNNWIKSLQSKGKQPHMHILEIVAVEDEEKAEINWIAIGRGKGWRLTNYTMGGDGRKPMPGTVMSEEHRRKIGEANKGKVYSPETLKKLGDIRRAFQARQTPEQKRAWGLARAHVYTHEQREAKKWESIGRKLSTAASKYRNVNYNKAGKGYFVEVQRDKVKYYGGFFKNEEDAARAADALILKFDGPRAKLNFPLD